MDRPAPRTVIRPAQRAAEVAALASPLIALAARIERAPRPDPDALANELRDAVAAFETAARRAGLRAEAILDARDALAAVVEARAQGNPALDQARWSRAVRRALPGSRMTQASELAAAADRASSRGDRELARFLDHCREAVAATTPATPRRRGWAAVLAVAGFAAFLVAWAGWADWRHGRDLLAGLPSVGATIAQGEGMPGLGRAATLDAFAAAVWRVERAAADAPVGLAARVPWLNPVTVARARYAEVATALVPTPLAEAVGIALATEGEALALYDSLRATAMLEGRAAWRARFLAGWILARTDDFPGLAGLAPHLAAMTAPPRGQVVSEAGTLAEASRFAAEGEAGARAYLELERADATGALAAWTPEAAAPGLSLVLVRRSGVPIEAGPPGLFTTAGWAHARDGGAAAAIALAATEAETLLGAGQEAQTDAVLDILQARTIAAWSGYLSDLRVRPFTDQPTALTITGTLGFRDTPLAALIRAVWRETGGEDRARSHANQLRVAAAFGPAIQFVEGGRMAEISRLFATLNVALQSLDADADLAAQRLMDVQARAISVAALSQAPRLVVEIVEDVLAQTSASSEGLWGNRALRLWRGELGPACAAAIDGRYPFGDGADADPEAVAHLLAPDGLAPRFFAEHLASMMDMSAAPWRWKPEARLSGFQPESVDFFERLAGLGAMFDAGGIAGTPITLTALAQRGAAQVSIGGASAAVVTSGAPATLFWPGPEAARGFEIAFDTGARAGAAGFWGMLRFLDGMRLRPRLDGRRLLLDMRAAEARAYLQMDFQDPVNPVTLRPALRGLSCPREL